MQFIECYDIGGTKLRAALVRKDKPKIVLSKTVDTIKGPQNLLRQILELSNFFRSHEKNIVAVSIGMPGIVVNGFLQRSHPLNITKPFNLSLKLKKYIKEPIFIENDLKAAVRAELHLGIGKKVKNFDLLTISTGIGVGIVIDGKALKSPCGEFGHDVLERNLKLANRCRCGNIGCWQAMASGDGIELTTKKELGKIIKPKELFELYKSGNPIAKKIVKSVRSYNAHGIGNMLNAFPPDVIVVMGSVGLNQFKSIIPTKNEIKKYTPNSIPRIVPTKLGEEIGIYGAYFVAREKMSN